MQQPFEVDKNSDCCFLGRGLALRRNVFEEDHYHFVGWATFTVTANFQELLLRQLLQHGTKMVRSLNNIQSEYQLRGCARCHLLPDHANTTWPTMQDIMRTPDVTS